jgi:hypothetical protein
MTENKKAKLYIGSDTLLLIYSVLYLTALSTNTGIEIIIPYSYFSFAIFIIAIAGNRIFFCASSLIVNIYNFASTVIILALTTVVIKQLLNVDTWVFIVSMYLISVLIILTTYIWLKEDS